MRKHHHPKGKHLNNILLKKDFKRAPLFAESAVKCTFSLNIFYDPPVLLPSPHLYMKWMKWDMKTSPV